MRSETDLHAAVHHVDHSNLFRSEFDHGRPGMAKTEWPCGGCQRLPGGSAVLACTDLVEARGDEHSAAGMVITWGPQRWSAIGVPSPAGQVRPSGEVL